MSGYCTAPGPEDGMVQGLLATVDCNVQSMVSAGYGALSAPNSPVAIALTTMLTLYIAFIGYRMLIGRSPLRIGDLSISAMKIGVVLVLATSWPTYQHLVFDTLFHGPEELAGGMLGNLQPPGSSSDFSAFGGLQAAYDEMQLSAAHFSKHSLSTSSPLEGGNAGAAMALSASALMMLMTSLGMVLAAKIVLGLLLGLGPIFVAFLLFDTTRGLFEGWLRASLAFALTPMMAILGLVVQLTLIGPQLVRLAEMRAGGPIDVGPANSIFLLTAIATVVTLGLGVAVGLIARGLRLPEAGRASSQQTVNEGASSSSQMNVQARPNSQLQLEPRAASVAAAAAAMERRDSRTEVIESASPRRAFGPRLRVEAEATTGRVQRSVSPRRSAQPRSAASNLRRDR